MWPEKERPPPPSSGPAALALSRHQPLASTPDSHPPRHPAWAGVRTFSCEWRSALLAHFQMAPRRLSWPDGAAWGAGPHGTGPLDSPPVLPHPSVRYSASDMTGVET